LTLRSFVAAVVLATLAGLNVGASQGAATSSSSTSVPRNGQIAWKVFPRPGDFTTASIYGGNPDGSRPRRLTHAAAGVVDDLPDWSPDGLHIMFERIFQPDSNQPTVADQVMRVDADGSNLHRIGSCTGACVGNDDPQYSPDGHQIVFTRAMHVRGTKLVELGVWVMSADGSHAREISKSVAGVSEDHEPGWSPDGKHIVFARLNDSATPMNKQALFIVRSTGGKARRITSWSLDAGGANWSPDDSTIIFESYRDCSCTETSQIYTVAPDGSRLKRLTSIGRNIEPAWSPDGKRIIYAHQPRAGSSRLPDLWIMTSTGGNREPVVQTKLWESEADWGTAPPVS
jgi:Tol biopolymer transport system component